MNLTQFTRNQRPGGFVERSTENTAAETKRTMNVEERKLVPGKKEMMNGDRSWADMVGKSSKAGKEDNHAKSTSFCEFMIEEKEVAETKE